MIKSKILKEAKKILTLLFINQKWFYFFFLILWNTPIPPSCWMLCCRHYFFDYFFLHALRSLDLLFQVISLIRIIVSGSSSSKFSSSSISIKGSSETTFSHILEFQIIRNRIKYKWTNTNSFITHFLSYITIRNKLYCRTTIINSFFTYYLFLITLRNKF